MLKTYVEIKNDQFDGWYDITDREKWFSYESSKELLRHGYITEINMSYFDTQEKYFYECFLNIPMCSNIIIKDSQLELVLGDTRTGIKALFNNNGLYRIEAKKGGSQAFVDGHNLDKFLHTKTGRIIKAKIKDYLIKKVSWL